MRESNLNQLEEELFLFNSTEILDVNVIKEISIAPVHISSGKKETGKVTDSVEI